MNIGNLMGLFSGSGGMLADGDSDFALILALILLLSADSDDKALIFALVFILM